MTQTVLEIYEIARMLSECTSRGDNTKCYEPRGGRVQVELRGTPLPKEYWCEHCKIRTRLVKLWEDLLSE